MRPAVRRRYGRARAAFDVEGLASLVDLAARDNAREAEGFFAAGGFDTEAGLAILRRYVRDVLETSRGDFETYSLGLKEPLTKAQTDAIWRKIAKRYGWKA